MTLSKIQKGFQNTQSKKIVLRTKKEITYVKFLFSGGVQWKGLPIELLKSQISKIRVEMFSRSK
jgi:hypothetical protein